MFRYRHSDRRIIGAAVGYGAVSSKSVAKDLGSWETALCILFKPPFLDWITSIYGTIPNYVRASTTSMVMGHLIARFAAKIENSITGTLKTFCIGGSLGGQLCGFAGKDYRHEYLQRCEKRLVNLVKQDPGRVRQNS